MLSLNKEITSFKYKMKADQANTPDKEFNPQDQMFTLLEVKW